MIAPPTVATVAVGTTAPGGSTAGSGGLVNFHSGGMGPRPPIIQELDIINGILGPGPNYGYQPFGVPVGANLGFQALSPSPQTMHIASVTWSGGTDWGNYFSADSSTTPAPQTMALQTGVPTNQSQYGFIVDSTEKTYTLTVTVTYTEYPGQPQSATVTFASHRPSVTLSRTNAGQYWFRNNGGPGHVMIDTEGGGEQFQASTTTGDFGTYFMFMQIVDVNHSHTPAGGGKVTVAATDYLDDGANMHLPIGMAIDGTSPVQDGWILGSNSSTTVTTTDPPRQPTPNTDTQLAVNDSFSTYVMYRPPGGDWIAVKEIDWTWVGSATKSGGSWPADTQFSVAAATVSTPSGANAFPPWNGRTGDLPLWS